MQIGHLNRLLSLATAALCAVVVSHLPAESQKQAEVSTPQAQTVQLGESTVELTGPWKFHTGDDLSWSQPDFNDSAWGILDLTPPPGSFDHFLGTSGFVPGWTARGFTGYSGYAWYRLRLNIQNVSASNASPPLYIKMPDNCDDAYQVYVDGQMIGALGRFAQHHVTTYLTRPRAFELPGGVRGGSVTIAIRTWMSPGSLILATYPGGLHGPPILGKSTEVLAMRQLDWDVVNDSNYSHMIEGAVLLLSIIIVLALARLDRNEPTYLWLGLACVDTLLILGLILAGDYTNLFSRTTVIVLQDDFLFPARIGLWIIFWGHWFRLGRIEQIHRWTWPLVIALAVGSALQRAPIYGTLVPVRAVAWLLPATVIIKLMLGALLIWTAYAGLRRDKADGALALPAVLLVGIAQYHYELLQVHVPVYYFPFGYRIALSQIGIDLSLCIITVLLVRRFVGTLRDQEKWRIEIDQAKHVQSMLVPTRPPATPGFALETIYLPASSVGGDFFHVMHEESGALLIVIGDVSGKGLRAAMTVGTIIGALRNELPNRPVQHVLERLNRVLCGQISGFVTCCVLRIETDGSMTISNAGHLAPYLGGAELTLINGFPLGLDPQVSYEASRFRIRPNQQLTLVTDGVVEARNRSGQLFGFGRTLAISTWRAEDLARAAQDFGQNDDITVLTLIRQPVPVEATSEPLTNTPAAGTVAQMS